MTFLRHSSGLSEDQEVICPEKELPYLMPFSLLPLLSVERSVILSVSKKVNTSYQILANRQHLSILLKLTFTVLVEACSPQLLH